MTKFNIGETLNKQREMNVNETLTLLRSYGVRFWCWGAHAFTNVKNRALRFKSEGRYHKGHVYISVSFLDLYDVHIVQLNGNLVKSIEGLYFDQLFDAIDKEIEFKG
jgi:hypothetical protein